MATATATTTTDVQVQLPEGRFGKYSVEQIPALIELLPENNQFIDGGGSESPLKEGENEVEITGESRVIRWGEGEGSWLFLCECKCTSTGFKDTFPYNPTKQAQMDLTKVGNVLMVLTKKNTKGQKRSTSLDIINGTA